MTLQALVAEAGHALGAARALFGSVPEGPGWASTSSLAEGRVTVEQAGQQAQTWLGQAGPDFIAANTRQSAQLGAIVAGDDNTAPPLPDAARAARDGAASMDGVIATTRSGVAAIAPATGTTPGKIALVEHLQGQLDRAKALLVASERRNIALATLLRRGAAAYPGSPPMGAGMGGVGAMPALMGGGGAMTGGAGGTSAMGVGGGVGGAMGSIGRLAGLGAAARRQENFRRTPGIGDPDLADLQPHPPGSAAQMAVKAALSKIGRPYVWGAKGPNSFDCSGLVQWAYAQAGVTVGADTYTLVNEGHPVPMTEVRAGDAVFPSSSYGEMGRSGPGHVMLAISPTECVEAQQSGVPVKISPMPSSFVARRLTGR